jgi:hypothetical protein
MRTHPTLIACALATAFFATEHPLQAADITYTEVDLLHQLSFETPYFANASWYNTLTLTVAPDSSGSQDFQFDLYPDNEGLTFFATGGVRVDQTSAPAGTSRGWQARPEHVRDHSGVAMPCGERLIRKLCL